MASYVATGDRVVPFSNMRRRTAEHMVRSKATSPHAFIAHEADFENVERIRRAWGERFKAEEGFSLTYLPFIARAAVEALRDYPNLNASVVDESLVLHHQVNLGIAVDLEHEGLIVPVVHRAEEVTLRGVARRIRDLADRARTRQLTADDISGGTFSITNDGPFGTYFTVPIINQPQVAILATDGIKRRPVVVELPDGTESIAIHSTGVLGMSWDHRAVDGAYVSSYPAAGGRIARHAVTGPPSSRGRDVLRVRRLGLVRYDEATSLQRALAARAFDDYLLALEHPHVYTMGVRADPAHVLVDPATVGADTGSHRPWWRRHLPRPGPAGALPDRHRARRASGRARPRGTARTGGDRRAGGPRGPRRRRRRGPPGGLSGDLAGHEHQASP